MRPPNHFIRFSFFVCFNWAIPDHFFFIFVFFWIAIDRNTVQIIHCRCRDSSSGSLVSEATALSTAPQPRHRESATALSIKELHLEEQIVIAEPPLPPATLKILAWGHNKKDFSVFSIFLQNHLFLCLKKNSYRRSRISN